MFKGDEIAYATSERASTNAQSIDPPAFLLTLPKLSSTIPSRYSMGAHPSIVQLARQLFQAGVIKPQDLKSKKSIDEVIQRVVAREIAAAVGNLKVLTPSIAISEGEIGGMCERTVELDENTSVTFQIYLDHSPVITIGKMLSALEDITEGLGQTVYSVLKAAAWAGMGLFTFDYAVDTLAFLYGLDEYGEDELGDEDDEESEDRVTKATLLANIPDWFVSPELKLTPEDVTRISNQTSTPQWAKTVLNATLQAADAWKKGSHKLGKFSYSDAEPAYLTAAIRFSEEDQMSRILDDYYDMCNNCSDHYTDAMHLELVDLSDTHKFNQWWEGILDGCRLLNRVDALLDALSCQLT